MKSLHKKATSLALFLASPVVLAGPPVPYGGWTVSNGNIDTSVSCSGAGVTCNALVDSQGMYYEQLDVNGAKFVRMIVTESDATIDPNAGVTDASEALSFSDETFVPFSLTTDPNTSVPAPDPGYNSFAAPQGIASKQVINDTVDNFNATTVIQRSNMKQYTGGWSVVDPREEMFSVKIDQSFDDGQMQSGFSHTAYTQFVTGANFNPTTGQTTTVDPVTGNTYILADPDTNHVIGRRTDISQNLDISDTATPNGTQYFEHRAREGYQGTSSPALFGFGGGPTSYLTGEPIVTAGSMSLDGGTTNVEWANGDSINTTWLGQASGPGGSISYQNVVNKSTAMEDSALIFDQPTGGATPFAWDAAFGPEPSH